jgi:hypothetical protein
MKIAIICALMNIINAAPLETTIAKDATIKSGEILPSLFLIDDDDEAAPVSLFLIDDDEEGVRMEYSDE